MTISYGSVCSGIEAASVAWHLLGFRASWFAEIEPFPSAVLAHRWPAVPNLGDMTKLAREVLLGIIAAQLILVGGTPCQDFSVAGMRAGLAVANLYAYRATDPRELWRCADPVSPENDRHLTELGAEYGDIVCAWGSHARPERVAAVVGLLLAAGARLWCLITNRDGSPKHPLYIKRDQPLVEWQPPAPLQR
ncbi:hypothetical protein DK254_24025 [Pseudomonas sp. RW407]|uniref:DUF1643 domain-containing protein n=1 Tax=Pseudomonas sp. RW407 TaxID=2202894 RepID=UPI000D6EE08F|nr:hypothetical protein DK254_24025 [Pseudomonas sp. RW407]